MSLRARSCVGRSQRGRQVHAAEVDRGPRTCAIWHDSLLRIEDQGLAAHLITARGIAFVPENRRLFPRLSVRDNLRLGSYLFRKRPDREAPLERVFQLFPGWPNDSTSCAETRHPAGSSICRLFWCAPTHAPARPLNAPRALARDYAQTRRRDFRRHRRHSLCRHHHSRSSNSVSPIAPGHCRPRRMR